MEGGAKIKAQANPNPRRPTFRMKAMAEELNAIFSMPGAPQPPAQRIRAPSQRAQQALAAKAAAKVAAKAQSEAVVRVKKPSGSRKLPVMREVAPVKPRAASMPNVKALKLSRISDNTIIKRNRSETFKFKNLEKYIEYIEKFNTLFKDARENLGLDIRNHEMVEGNAINEKESSKMIVHITDHLYFKIRDNLLMTLGIRSKTPHSSRDSPH